MTTASLASFNYWMEAARRDLTQMAEFSSPAARASFLRTALHAVKEALRVANVMGCAARKRLCFRIRNWLRADLRRV